MSYAEMNKIKKNHVMLLYAGFLLALATSGLSLIPAIFFAFTMRKMDGWQGTHVRWLLGTIKWLVIFIAAAIIITSILFAINLNEILDNFGLDGNFWLLMLALAPNLLLFVWYHYRAIRGLIRTLREKEI